MSTVQAVLFQGYDDARAKAWLRANRFTPIKPAHVSGSLLRYRIVEPDFDRYTTKVIETARGKVFLVLGWRGNKKKGGP
jgi:hypothetical protein